MAVPLTRIPSDRNSVNNQWGQSDIHNCQRLIWARAFAPNTKGVVDMCTQTSPVVATSAIAC